MKSPWKWSTSLEPDREYLVLASSIPPNSRRSTWRLFRGASAVRKQLALTDGVIGFSLLARPPSQAVRHVVGVDRRRRSREVCWCRPAP